MIENIEFKELPLHSINNLKSTDVKLNNDPIYDFEDDTEDTATAGFREGGDGIGPA